MTSATPTATTTAPTTAPITPLDSRPEWKALLAHAEKIKATHLRDIFKQDPKRGGELAVNALDMHFDFLQFFIVAGIKIEL